MPGRKTRTSPLLILIAILLCLFSGGVLTRSSAGPSSGGQKLPDMFVAENNSTQDSLSDSGTNRPENTPTPTVSPTNTPIPTVTLIPKPTSAPDASLEASRGTWSAKGSSWQFLVDGVPYTGWLCDLDGQKYFFNNEGIMQTGWLDIDNKRYYLNSDGIMQTGEVVIDGKTYYFLKDGSLKGYTPEKESSEKTAKKKPTKTIAITFDDGPSSYTDRLLECLKENNAKATFFMVGQEISNFPDTVKKMSKLEMELGNHTYSHIKLTNLSQEVISSEIAKTDQLLLELTGQGATVVRPPFGSINDAVEAEVETPMILWSVDTLDWELQDTQKIVQAVLDNAGDGEIILLHDIFKETVDAAEIFIPKLIEEGYELVTVHQLAEVHGVDLKNGIAYGSMK